MRLRRLVVGMLLIDLLVLAVIDAVAAPYRLTFTAPDARFGRCAATWNGVPWVLDIQAASFGCGPYRCTDAAQMQAPPADVQLACYLDPNPAATVAPASLSNVVTLALATALPGSPGATVTPTPLRTATRTATPLPATTATATVVPAGCVPIVTTLGLDNDYWGDPASATSVREAARQLLTLRESIVPCGLVVRGYGEVGATGSKTFELWREDLTARVDGGVASASLEVASALQPRDFVLGWNTTTLVPAGRYWLRAAGPTTGGRWRWSATTPGAGAWTSNVDRRSTFAFVLYGRRVGGPGATGTPVPTRTATPTSTRTATPVPTVTRTPVPSSTATRTVTPLPLPTLTPTPWPTTTPPYDRALPWIDVQFSDGSYGRFSR